MKAKQLYELQEIDQEIDRKKQALERVEGELGHNEEIVAAQLALEEARKSLAEFERQQKAEERGVEDLGAKIAEFEVRLYGGQVRNPRELLSIQSEVEHLKARRRRQEDVLLEIMAKVEEAQAQVSEGAGRLERMEQEWQEKQRRLLAEQAELKSELARLEEQWTQAVAQIDAPSLALYGKLRAAKGAAVAKAEQGRCQGCRIGLPMSDLQRARMGQELVQCSNCQRILYIS